MNHRQHLPILSLVIAAVLLVALLLSAALG